MSFGPLSVRIQDMPIGTGRLHDPPPPPLASTSKSSSLHSPDDARLAEGVPYEQGHRSSAGARRPISVILTRATSIARPPETTRSVHVVAIPVRMSCTRKSTVNPCASMIASLQPSGDAASSSSARRRSGFGPRLRRE